MEGFLMLQEEINLIINKAKNIYNNIESLEKNNDEIHFKMIQILNKENQKEKEFELEMAHKIN